MRASSTVLDAGKLDGKGIAAVPAELTGSPVVAVGRPVAEFNPPIATDVFRDVTFG